MFRLSISVVGRDYFSSLPSCAKRQHSRPGTALAQLSSTSSVLAVQQPKGSSFGQPYGHRPRADFMRASEQACGRASGRAGERVSVLDPARSHGRACVRVWPRVRACVPAPVCVRPRTCLCARPRVSPCACMLLFMCACPRACHEHMRARACVSMCMRMCMHARVTACACANVLPCVHATVRATVRASE